MTIEKINTRASRAWRVTSSVSVARNAVLSLLNNAWVFLVLVIAMPKLVHYLGEVSFGLFSIAWVMIGYLTLLDVGVNRATTKFVSEHLAKQDGESTCQIVRTALATNLLFGLAGGLAVVFASPYLIHSIFKVSAGADNEALRTFHAVGLAVPVLLVQGIFKAVLSSLQRFGWINAIDAVVTAAQWGTAAFLAWKGYGVALVVFSTVLARIVATAAYGFVMFRLLPNLELFRARKLNGLAKLLQFGGWVTVSQLVSPLLVYLDRVLIASFLSLAAVTLYTVPFEATTRLRLIPFSVAGTLYPAFSERGDEGQKQQLETLYERSVRYLLLIMMPGVVYLFVLGPDLFGIWMGPSFGQQTSAVVRILTVGLLANGLAFVPYSLVQALGRPDLTGKLHLLELPLYVVLCVLLIPRSGIAGAALASTVRFVLDSAMLFFAASNYCRCELRGFWVSSFPRILTLSSALGLTLFGIKLVLHSPWARLGLGLLAVAICLLAAWNFGVNSAEKPRLSGVVKTLLGQPAC
jgi:O-antigen/teichoic acid export membrane protein